MEERSMRITEGNSEYYRFTGPQRIDKAIHTLEGMLTGIAIDSAISEQEAAAILGWTDTHSDVLGVHPFNQIIPRLEEALEDGVLDEEEKADLLWLCGQLKTDSKYFNLITSDMQRLQGILYGIAADGVIEIAELDKLQEWMGEREHLRKTWPYDELESLIFSVLADGKIDEVENKYLWAFFKNFTEDAGHHIVEAPAIEEDMNIFGLCASCPEISFKQTQFCITGRSERVPRKELVDTIESLGAVFRKSVVRGLDYLIVGCEGNDAWAFSCYGRKVEQAINLRKQGSPLLIVHENDFWDAVEDSNAGIE